MNISLLPGTLLVSPAPDEAMSKGGIHYPDVERVVACIGLCHLHEPGGLIGEDLTGKNVVIQKWSQRSFEWNGTLLWVIRENAILAVLEDA